MFYKPVEDWHNSVSSALLKEVAIFKQWSSSDTEVKTSNEKNRTARSEFLQNYLVVPAFFKKWKLHTENWNLKWKSDFGKQRRPREREGRFKGWRKKTPDGVQTMLRCWVIRVTLSISSSDKGLIARSSVGKCHVKINQSRSIRTEKHTYITKGVLSPSLLACISNFLFFFILL